MSERPPGPTEPAEAGAPTATASRPEDGHPSSDGHRDEWAAGKRGRQGKHQGKPGGALAFARELPVLIIIAFLLALLIKTFLVQAFYIPSGSMEPTLEPGDRVLVIKVAGAPGRGDIIVFENPDPSQTPDRGVVGGFLHWLSEGLGFARPSEEDFIKRVIGLPGETVEYRGGVLTIDGRPLDEPYLRGRKDTRQYGPVTVPDGKLFVMGDNRLSSNDSRFALGFIPLDKVVGKAFVIIWPPSRIGWLRGP